MLLINITLLCVGTIMEGLSLVLILTPILLPLMKSLGIDPIHFGVLFVLNVQIGSCTPPVGMVLYTICSVSRVSIYEFGKEYLPFFIANIVVLLLMTYIPEIVLYVPRLLFGI